MNTSEMLEKVLSALSANAALLAWVREIYGKDLKVVFDVDPDDPPADEQYPLAAIMLVEHARDNTSNRLQEWQIVLGLCLKDEATLNLAGTDIAAGKIRVERFRELAETAVMAAGVGKVECDGSVEREVLHPLYAAASVITITYK